MFTKQTLVKNSNAKPNDNEIISLKEIMANLCEHDFAGTITLSPGQRFEVDMSNNLGRYNMTSGDIILTKHNVKEFLMKGGIS